MQGKLWVFILLILGACKSVVKPSVKALYDQDTATDTNQLNGYTAVEVYQDIIDR